MKYLIEILHHHKFQFLVGLFVVLALVMGALVVPLETEHPESNIDNLFDGVYWAVTTMTGVGYGDYTPVTVLGRLVGMVLMVAGLVVFGLIAGYIAVTLFSIKDKFYWRRLYKRIDELESKIGRLEKAQGFLVKNGKE